MFHLHCQRCLPWVLTSQVTHAFPLSTSKTVTLWPGCKSLDTKSAGMLVFVPLYIVSFSRVDFKTFPFIPGFQELDTPECGFYFVFSLLKFSEHLGCASLEFKNPGLLI